MKKHGLYLGTILLLVSITAFAQKGTLSRSPLQQRYLLSAFIEPQLKKGPLKITRNEQIDSVFSAWEIGWRKVSADSMANNPTKLTKEEFNNLDAYCYFWGLASITQNLNAGDDYGSLLVSKYMVPSLRRDLALVKRSAIPDVIENLDLANTFAIGSGVGVSRDAFLETYALYRDCYALYGDLAQHTDTLVSAAAKKQLPMLQRIYYVMNARNSYYLGDKDQAFTYLVTGLNADKYSKPRAIDLTKKLTLQYMKGGEKDKAFALLNTLAIHTTPDNLNRDTLQSCYRSVDAVAGPEMYSNLKSKLSASSFKAAEKQVKLPGNWYFIANEIPAYKLNKAKYILVDFWYTSCGPCLAEIPELNAFYEKIKTRDDIVLISVNTDYENGKMNRTFVKKRSKELRINYPVFYDSSQTTLNKQLGITAYPTKVILASNGQQLVKTDLSTISTLSFYEFLKEKK